MKLHYFCALNQLWRRTISTLFCTGLVDNAAVALTVAIIKHSAYANERLLASRSALYNEVDEDGSVNLIAEFE